MVQSNHFYFWRAVRNAALTLTAACNGEACVLPSYAHVRARGGPLREGTPPEVRINEQVGLRERGAISCPTDHSVMEGGLYVANEPVEASIAFGRPMCYKTREMADRAKEVKPCHASTI